MTFQAVTLYAARLLMILSAVLSLISVVYIFFKVGTATRNGRLNPSNRSDALFSVVGAFVMLFTLIFVFGKYTEAQSERKELLMRLSGISQEIDSELKAGRSSRVSYNHTRSMLERAAEACAAVHERGTESLPSGCKMIAELY